MNLDSLAWSDQSLKDRADRKFSAQERARILKTLDLPANNEQQPSLRVHALAGNLTGVWSASVTGAIRIHFLRLPEGRKRLVNISKH